MMAGDEEVEAVAFAIAAHFGPNDSPADAARSAIAALDRVRFRPAGSTTGGTEGEDHEAGIEKAAAWLAATDGYPWAEVQVLPKADVYREKARGAAAFFSRAPSPVSGTEPDTAKLVEALVKVDHHIRAALAFEAYRPNLHEARQVVAVALAGFSVDAGKPEERHCECENPDRRSYHYRRDPEGILRCEQCDLLTPKAGPDGR